MLKLFILSLIVSVLEIQAYAEYDLHMHLFANYSPSVRPVRHRITPTIVKFNMKLMRIIAVEEKLQTVTSQAYFSVKWNNEFMRWNPQRWGNVKTISTPPENVWIPDVILKNNANSDALRIQKGTETVWIKHNGDCAWYPKVTIMSSFRADVTYFPFDSQNFIFHFGSWSFDERQIKILKEDKKMLDKHYLNDSEWDLVSTDNHIHRSSYDDIAYSEIIFTYFFSRKPTYSVITAIVPSIGLMSMALFSYLLPPDIGERIAVLITSLLAFTVFLVEINGSLPRNSDSVPIVQVFYMVTMAECILCFIVSCLLARLVAVNRDHEVPFTVPIWMRKMMPSRKNFVATDSTQYDGFSKGFIQFTRQLARKCSSAQVLLQKQPSFLDFKSKSLNSLKTDIKPDINKSNNKIINSDYNNNNITNNSNNNNCSNNINNNNSGNKKNSISNKNRNNNSFYNSVKTNGGIKNNTNANNYKKINAMVQAVPPEYFAKTVADTTAVQPDVSDVITWGMFAECMDKICMRVFSMFFLTSSVGIFVAAYLKQGTLQQHFVGAH